MPEEIIDALQRAPLGSLVNIAGKQCRVTDYTYRELHSEDTRICARCGFYKMKQKHFAASTDNAVCPMFRACCNAYRPDRRTVVFNRITEK